MFFTTEEISQAEKQRLENYKAPANAKPWEVHYNEKIIQKHRRTPELSTSWAGVDEPWFKEARAKPEYWPQFMNSYDKGQTGNLFRDNRLNREDILYFYEVRHDCNLHVYAANMKDGKLTEDAHTQAVSNGPIWNYWWHMDKDWIHTQKNGKGKWKSKLANAKPSLDKCTPEFRKANQLCDRFSIKYEPNAFLRDSKRKRMDSLKQE